MTPADIPSLVDQFERAVKNREFYRPKNMRATERTDLREAVDVARTALLDALSPKEAELVKPPREYEGSGDAVGEVQDGLSRAIAAQLPDIANIGARTPAVGGIPAGMVAWGPEHPDYPNAPKDYVEGHVQFRNGSLSSSAEGPWWWRHDANHADIIAYTPCRTASHDAARERIAELETALREIGELAKTAAEADDSMSPYSVAYIAGNALAKGPIYVLDPQLA